MSYNSLLQQLYSINRSYGMKLGLETIKSLCNYFGNPQKQFRTVHVAGTNGKGSTVTKIAASLQYAGYLTGRYMSPHISSFCERIAINSEPISQEEVTEYLQAIFDRVEKERIPATFFELTTLLAFLFFAQKRVDIAVIETGIGGRLDATAVCAPLLSVITSISFDHTAILGNTIEEITKEKAGIMKAQTPVVIGPRVPVEVIEPLAVALDCPLYVVSCEEERLFCHFDDENCLIAKKSLDVLSDNIPLNSSAIEKGLKAAAPCRFEIVSNELLTSYYGYKPQCEVLLDVAHNPDGMQHLFAKVKACYPNRAIYTLYGASEDKDLQGCLKQIIEHSQALFCVEAISERAAKVDILKQIALQIKPESQVFACSLIEEGIQSALQFAACNDAIVVVCGTFFIMKDIRAFLGYEEPKDFLQLHEGVAKLANVS